MVAGILALDLLSLTILLLELLVDVLVGIVLGLLSLIVLTSG